MTGNEQGRQDDRPPAPGLRAQRSGLRSLSADANRNAPSSSLPLGQGEAIGATYADFGVVVDLTEPIAVADSTSKMVVPMSKEAQQPRQNDTDAALLTATGHAGESVPLRITHCRPAMTIDIGTMRNPIPMNNRHRDPVHATRRSDQLPGGPSPRDAQRDDRVSMKSSESKIPSRDDQGEDEEQPPGTVGELADDLGPAGDRAAEEVGGARAENTGGGNRIAESRPFSSM